MRRALLLFGAVLGGCVLDFEGALQRGRDAGAPSNDLGSSIDRPTIDAGVPLDAMDAGDAHEVAPPVDVAVEVDAGGCGPTLGVELRLAHMGARVGPMRLCMRRGAGAFAAVRDARWPQAGVAESQVSARVSTNDAVTEQNESWQFAVIPVALGCESITAEAPATASLTAQLDPGDRVTLLLSSQMNSQGRIVGVLGLLQDKVCTQCPTNSYDIRAVHAAFGASRARLEFSIDYVMPGSEPSLVNVFFAQSVGYGSTSPTGDRGFDCDSAWYLGAMLPPTSLVGLSAFEVGGDALANSQRFHLKGAQLSVSRVATVFFRGDWVDGTQPPEFVLCYDGMHDAGMTVCDRIPSFAVQPVDAGASDANVVAPLDVGIDAHAADAHAADAHDDLGADDASADDDAGAHDAGTHDDAGAPAADVLTAAEADGRAD